MLRNPPAHRKLTDNLYYQGERISESRCGNCHDNAVSESFFQLQKRERVQRQNYHRFNANSVIGALSDLFILCGVPGFIRSDNVRYREDLVA